MSLRKEVEEIIRRPLGEKPGGMQLLQAAGGSTEIQLEELVVALNAWVEGLTGAVYRLAEEIDAA